MPVAKGCIWTSLVKLPNKFISGWYNAVNEPFLHWLIWANNASNSSAVKRIDGRCLWSICVCFERLAVQSFCANCFYIWNLKFLKLKSLKKSQVLSKLYHFLSIFRISIKSCHFLKIFVITLNIHKNYFCVVLSSLLFGILGIVKCNIFLSCCNSFITWHQSSSHFSVIQ